MKLGGFQKLTLLDYPGRVACIVFTRGCNFRCPYCHNSTLVIPEKYSRCIDESVVFDYLNKRKGILEGVVITGGEPLMQKGIGEFIKKIKDMGYLVKLDTNGSFPDILCGIIEYVDYVALDIKGPAEKYGIITGTQGDKAVSDVKRSIDIIKKSGKEYEMRTTFVKGLHKIEDMSGIGELTGDCERYYIQSYVDSGNIIMADGLCSFDDNELENMLNEARKFCKNAEIRR